MTEAERKAMEWLDTFLEKPALPEARTLKAMLARTVLPEEPTPEMIKWFADSYRALYAHLTAPKIKEVEVECWGVLTEAGVAGSYFDERSARNDTMVKEGAGHVVRLTGRATVPA